MDSARKRLTLCIVMRAVGDDEIMMIGYMVPAATGQVRGQRYRLFFYLRDFFMFAFGS